MTVSQTIQKATSPVEIVNAWIQIAAHLHDIRNEFAFGAIASALKIEFVNHDYWKKEYIF